MDGELDFEGSIRLNIKKKTKRAKWKLNLKQLNKTDMSIKINCTLDKDTVKSDLVVHNNPDQTVNVDGYVIENKKRKSVTLKNMKLSEIATASKEKAALTALSTFM